MAFVSKRHPAELSIAPTKLKVVHLQTPPSGDQSRITLLRQQFDNDSSGSGTNPPSIENQLTQDGPLYNFSSTTTDQLCDHLQKFTER